MRKKFLSAFMLGLLALGTAGTITSCKDYDGDISSLKNDLSTLNSNLTSQLNDLKSTLAAQKSELETKIATAKTELQAAIDQKADKTTVEALAARVSTLETELVTVKSRLDLVEADIATLKATVAEKADKTELEAAKTALETKIADAKSALQAAIDLKADKTVTDALEAEITALKNRVQALESSVQALENGKVDKTEFAEYKLQVAADISTINGEIETLKGAIEELKGVDADLAAKILAEVAARTTADEALAKALAAAVEAQGEVNDEVAQKIADLVVADGQLQEQITTLAGVVEALSNKEKLDIENLSSKLDALKASTLEALNALADQIADFKEQVAATYATKASVSELETNLKTLMQNADDAVKTALTTKINEEIALVSGDVETLSFLIQKRLTSIVFMPSTYFNGVEAITFQTLRYPDWSKDAKAWLANGPVAGHKTVTAGDKEATAEYYLNPTGVDESSIAALSFISNKASDIWGRGDENKAPVGVKGFTIKDNKLTVQLVKTDSIYCPYDSPEGGSGQIIPFADNLGYSSPFYNFTIVSLKATLADKVLTTEEKEAGNDVNVYSDWARVIGSVATPYIHDARSYDAEDDYAYEGGNGVQYQYPYSSHYYNFTEIYDDEDSLNAKYSFDRKHIALSVRYDAECDLDTLMMICDGRGQKIDPEQYGFHFEYSTTKYLVLNENETSDATDQSKYIKMSGDHNNIIRSCIANGTINNRDAIGKTPVIQVRLVDENGVVADVRYFRVLWADVDPSVETREQFDGEADYVCGEDYDVVLGEDYLNAEVYAKEGKNGMSQKEFHATFTFGTHLHATPEGAISQSHSDNIGMVDDEWSRMESTQAHNITVTFFGDDVEMNEKLYNGGDTTLVGYVGCRNEAGTVVRVIPVTVKISYKADKAAYDYNYNSTYWAGGDLTIANKDKYVVVNPTLETDPVYGLESADKYTDAQLVYDLKNAYIKGGKAPEKIKHILKNVDGTTLVVIDSTRLDILPKKAESDTWSVKVELNGGSDLYYNGKKAAHLSPNGVINLVEKTVRGKSGQPAEGALLLVNYDFKSGDVTATTKNAIPVAVVSSVCGYPIVIDQYLVRFEQPLTFTAAGPTVTVKDQIAKTTIGKTEYKGSVATTDITKSFEIKELYGLKRKVNGDETLESWYIVGTPSYGDEILVNVDEDGNIIPDNQMSKWSNIDDLVNARGDKLYTINLLDVDGKKLVQFINQNGVALQKDIKAVIPVSVDTKWRKGVTYNVTVEIKENRSPGTQGGAKRK